MSSDAPALRIAPSSHHLDRGRLVLELPPLQAAQLQEVRALAPFLRRRPLRSCSGASQLCGAWRGQSERAGKGEVTEWREFRLAFSMTGDGARGVFAGHGQSSWRQHSIPFLIEG